MAGRLSRRKIAEYYAKSLIEGSDAKSLSMQLAAYLVESKRVNELSSIITDIEYYLSLSDVVLARVTSAHELSDLTKDAIVSVIKNKTKAKDVQIQEFIDVSVLGGMKLQFAGSEIDMTIARQLNTLKTNYKK